MAFKMRSGNKPEFKSMGGSPMKKDFEDYDKKDMDLDGNVTRSEKRAYRQASREDRRSGAAKRTRQVKRASRRVAEAREREETGITGAEQLARRVGEYGDQKSKSKLGKFARGVINTMIDPTSTDIGLLARATKGARQRIKQSITGELPEGERLLTGDQGLLRQARDTFRTIKDRRTERRASPPMTKKKKYCINI